MTSRRSRADRSGPAEGFQDGGRSASNRRGVESSPSVATHSRRARLIIPTILAFATMASCNEAGWGENVGDGCVLIHGHDDVVTVRTCQVGPTCTRYDSPDGQIGRTVCIDEPGCTVTTEPDAAAMTEC